MSISQQLEALETSSLIQVFATQPELEYLFRHALVQEAAYSAVLHADRRHLHRIVGQTLERLYVDRLDAVAGLLAEHYSKAADDVKAAEYAKRAGDAAERMYAHPEARGHYARALAALARLPASAENDRRQVDTILKQVSVSLRADGPQQSLERLREAEAILDRCADPHDPAQADRLRRARIHFWMGHVNVHAGRMRESLGYMQQVLDEAQNLGDEDLLATPAAVIGRALTMQGQFAKASALLQQALPPLQKVSNWPEWIITSSMLGVSLAAQGDVRGGIAQNVAGQKRAEQLGYAIGIAQAHSAFALISWMTYDAQRMEAETRAMLAVAEQANERLYLGMGGYLLSLALNRQDKPTEAAAQLTKSDAQAQQLGSTALSDWFAAARAEMTLRTGNKAEALRLAEQAAAQAGAARGLYAGGLAQRVWGEALATFDPPRWDEAEAHLRESLRLLDEGSATLEAARTHAVWGKLCRARGEAAAAQAHLNLAHRQFEASGITSEL